MKIIVFRSYFMVFTGTTSTSKKKSIPSIVLRESNEDGGQFFMLLYTGKEININDWVKLTIDDEFVKRVEELEKK